MQAQIFLLSQIPGGPDDTHRNFCVDVLVNIMFESLSGLVRISAVDIIPISQLHIFANVAKSFFRLQHYMTESVLVSVVGFVEYFVLYFYV